jgi:NADH-quinone oxidoreductase subunit H
MFESVNTFGSSLLGGFWPTTWSVVKILALVVPLMLCVAYLTLWERKAIGWSQIRPARTGSARSACCSRSPMR